MCAPPRQYEEFLKTSPRFTACQEYRSILKLFGLQYDVLNRSDEELAAMLCDVDFLSRLVTLPEASTLSMEELSVEICSGDTLQFVKDFRLIVDRNAVIILVRYYDVTNFFKPPRLFTSFILSCFRLAIAVGGTHLSFLQSDLAA